MNEREIREKIKEAKEIEEKANCPADKIIAGFLKRKLINMFIDKRYPNPKEL